MTVCFFGHRDAPDHLFPSLLQQIRRVIQQNGASYFLVGSQGAFDHMALRALRQCAAEFPHVSYAVVLAYLPQETTNDPSVFPEGLESAPKRFAIDRRNRWMLSRADLVITYVKSPAGGAAKYKKLASTQGKVVLELSEEHDG